MPHLQTRVAFLPYGPKILKSLKPVPYEREPVTLGAHLRKRRLELGLRQRDIQDRFGLDKETLANWEKDRCYPAMRHWRGIIEFLGFDPTPEPKTIGERLLAYRRQHGLSRKALATFLRADEHTVWRWEAEVKEPSSLFHKKALADLFVDHIRKHANTVVQP